MKAARKAKKTKKIFVTIICLLVCVIVALIAILVSYSGKVYTQCVAEAGTPILAENFLKDPSQGAVFTEDSPAVNNKVPGDYPVTIKSGMFTYHCTVTIQDTVPPVVTGQKVYTAKGSGVAAEDFVSSIQDETATTVTFVTKPDYSVYGEQKVTVQVMDLGGNTTTCETTLVVSSVKREITKEAGSAFPSLNEFLASPETSVGFVTATSSIDMALPGDYVIDIRVNGTVYPSTLHVVDTTAPTLQLQNVTTTTVDSPAAERFVASAQDVTPLTYSYVKEPDLSIMGQQEVTIRATDTSGNSTEASAFLTRQTDTEAPILSGVKDFTTYLGETISYKNGVTIQDALDTQVTLNVDTSKVNVKATGSYPVTYTALDRSGNKTSKTITLTIIERVYADDMVYDLVQPVLNQIFTNGMSERDKLTAIYEWIQSNISYAENEENTDWTKAAYEGLTSRRGDCFVYASVAKAFLNCAGIKNMDIGRIPTTYEHYWNLVDIGDGWYHFDTTPRAVRPKPNFCYVDDATITEFSNANNGSHNYDRTIFTDIN